MPYSLEKATALLVRELNASPDSTPSLPTFQHLLLAPAGPIRDQVIQDLARSTQTTVRSLDLPPAPLEALHGQDGLRTFSQTLRDAAQALHQQGGGLLVLNDLGRTSLVLQNVAITCMSRAALKKAGLTSVHVLWTADPEDILPNTVVNQVLPMPLDLSPLQEQRMQSQDATNHVAHVRIPDLARLADSLPMVQATPPREAARPALASRAA